MFGNRTKTCETSRKHCVEEKNRDTKIMVEIEINCATAIHRDVEIKQEPEQSEGEEVTATYEPYLEVKKEADDNLYASCKRAIKEEAIEQPYDGKARTIIGTEMPKSAQTEDISERSFETQYCHRCNLNLSQSTRTVHKCAEPPTCEKFICDLCEKSFQSKDNIIGHLSIHSEVNMWCCKICNKRFSQKSGLISHELIHSDEKKFDCEFCSKQFVQKSDLTHHMRTYIHTIEKPKDNVYNKFVCDICKKQFKNKFVLNRHKKVVHSEQKSHCCLICEKRFVQKCNLNRHVLIHSNKKPFHCKVCKKQFTSKTNLVEHERVHSGDKPFQCKICSKPFAFRSSFNRHIKCVHGNK